MVITVINNVISMWIQRECTVQSNAQNLKTVWNPNAASSKELAVLRSNGKLSQNNGAATEKRCLPNTVYKMAQKENVVSMIAENVKVYIGPRLLPDNPVVAWCVI